MPPHMSRACADSCVSLRFLPLHSFVAAFLRDNHAAPDSSAEALLRHVQRVSAPSCHPHAPCKMKRRPDQDSPLASGDHALLQDADSKYWDWSMRVEACDNTRDGISVGGIGNMLDLAGSMRCRREGQIPLSMHPSAEFSPRSAIQLAAGSGQLKRAGG